MVTWDGWYDLYNGIKMARNLTLKNKKSREIIEISTRTNVNFWYKVVRSKIEIVGKLNIFFYLQGV